MARTGKDAVGGGDGTNFDEVRYEGYGPGGVAIIVETLTDNRNRTASEVRAAFTKFGGNLGETGSVGFMFDHVGLIKFSGIAANPDDMFEAALEAGAIDVETSEDGHEVYCNPNELATVRDALENKFGSPEDARLDWRPQTTTELDEKNAATLLKLLNVLEDNDDVQRLASNFEVSDEVMERLSN